MENLGYFMIGLGVGSLAYTVVKAVVMLLTRNINKE